MERDNSSVAKLFLKLGLIGFGGPAVHIALMEEEVVRKRKWMDHQHFLDLVGATNLIPGPNSTEMAMHIGRERAGTRGLVTAGACFIIPAVLITAIFAWLYNEYGQLPAVQPFIYGIKPAIIAVIFVTMIYLGRQAWKSTVLGIIGILCAVAVLAGVNEILVLFAAGFAGIFIQLLRKRNSLQAWGLPFAVFHSWTLLSAIAPIKLFWLFLKISAILYGSGYVLFAFLDAELVDRGWLNKQELIDAIAVGQFTPGPVFSSATFIGWQIAGPWGAVAATIGIFLPSFFFVALVNPLIPKLRSSKIMSAFLDTVNIAAVAIILSVLVEMGKATFSDWRTILIAVLSAIVTFRFRKLNTAFIILGGALAGYLLSQV